MREIRTSGSMSGDGKRDQRRLRRREHPRPSSTLPTGTRNGAEIDWAGWPAPGKRICTAASVFLPAHVPPCPPRKPRFRPLLDFSYTSTMTA